MPQASDTSQTPLSSQSCIRIQSDSTLVNLPTFLEKVSPAPGSTTKLGCYLQDLEGPDLNKGVYGIVMVAALVEEGEKLDVATAQERVDIFVDTGSDNSIPQTGWTELGKYNIYDREKGVVTSFPGPRTAASLHAKLVPGEHTATIQLHKPSGEVLEYSWTFTIVP